MKQAYHKEIIALLKKQILAENKFANIQENYLYESMYFPSIRFDLVVLYEKEEHYIKEVYYICSFSTYKGHYHTLREKLMRYNQVIQVGFDNIYLAFKNEKGELQIVSLRDLDSSMEDIKPRTATISSFSKFYSTIKKWKSEYDSDESRFFFRGLSKTSYVSLPSIYRNDSLISNEDRLYHEAIRRNPTEFPDEMNTFDKLVKMQHYELPTRLLDITTNPLVALYFACKDNLRFNGSVLMYPILQEDIQYYDSDLVSILANIAKRSKTFTMYPEESEDEWRGFIRDIENESPNAKNLIDKHIVPGTLCVLPKLNNNRIINQDGAFFIFGINHTKKQPARLPDLPNIITIKASAKQSILEELDLMGINEASLFPETDKVMRQIKEEFCGN